MRPNIDFYIHWLWTATFGMLALSGFALMGARFGWVMNYALTVADFIHRTMSAVFVALLAIAVLLEILRLLIKINVSFWMMVGTGMYQVFTLVSTLLMIISGLYIWICMEFSPAGLAFSMVVHELVSFIAVGSIVWHIWKKAYVFDVK